MLYRFAHFELFADWEQPDLAQFDGRLALYGAGRRGGVAAHCLKKLGMDFLCFCDSDPVKWGSVFCGKPVISPGELRDKYLANPVLVTSNRWFEIKADLARAGFATILNCVGLFREIDFSGYAGGFGVEYMMRNTDWYYYTLLGYATDDIIATLLLQVNDRCTLRCRECSVYVPYVREPRDYDLDVLVAGVRKLLGVFRKVFEIRLAGGEVLLYEKLPELLRFLLASEQIEKVTIVTNGTLLPAPGALPVLENPKIFFRVTDYGKLSPKKDELLVLLKNKSIPFEVTNHDEWRRTPVPADLRETEERTREKYAKCIFKDLAKSVIDRYFCVCYYPSYWQLYNALPPSREDVIDLSNPAETGGKLRMDIAEMYRKLRDGIPHDACKYCDCDPYDVHLPVASQTTENLEFGGISV